MSRAPSHHSAAPDRAPDVRARDRRCRCRPRHNRPRPGRRGGDHRGRVSDQGRFERAVVRSRAVRAHAARRSSSGGVGPGHRRRRAGARAAEDVCPAHHRQTSRDLAAAGEPSGARDGTSTAAATTSPLAGRSPEATPFPAAVATGSAGSGATGTPFDRANLPTIVVRTITSLRHNLHGRILSRNVQRRCLHDDELLSRNLGRDDAHRHAHPVGAGAGSASDGTPAGADAALHAPRPRGDCRHRLSQAVGQHHGHAGR